MKNGAKTEKQVNRKGKLQEILGDDYWAKSLMFPFLNSRK